MKLLEGKEATLAMLLPLLEIKRIDTILRFLSRLPPSYKWYIIKYLPTMNTDDEKKLVDALTPEYYLRLFLRAQTNYMRDYIFNKVVEPEPFISDWLLSVERDNAPVKIREAVDYSLKRGISIPDWFIYKYLEYLPQDAIVNYLRNFNNPQNHLNKATIKRYMGMLDPRIRSGEATKLLNRIKPSQLNIYQLDALLKYGADPSELRKKMQKDHKLRQLEVYKHIQI